MVLAESGMIVVALVCLAAGGVMAWMIARRPRGGGREVTAIISIEKMRSVGELIVLRVLAKEIVTQSEHWAGEFGKRFLSWLWSDRKLAMVFEFDINFKYDLRSSDFDIEDLGQGHFRLKMPTCHYDIAIKSSKVYDVQAGRLRLLPDVINVFGGDVDQDDLNRLMEEAQSNIERAAKELIDAKRADIEQSARQTLEAMARGFGASRVTLDFAQSQFVQEEAA